MAPERVRRRLPQRGVAAGRDQRGAAAHAAAASVSDPDAAPVLIQAPSTRCALADRDARMLERARREHLGDAASGLRAAGVHDAAARVAALAAEALVELDAELDQVGDPRRRIARQLADRALAADAAAGAQGVLGVQARIVVLAERRGDAALGVEAVGGRELAPAQHEHVGLVRRGQRGVETGDTCADDDKSVPRHGVLSSQSITPPGLYTDLASMVPAQRNFEEPTT